MTLVHQLRDTKHCSLELSTVHHQVHPVSREFLPVPPYPNLCSVPHLYLGPLHVAYLDAMPHLPTSLRETSL